MILFNLIETLLRGLDGGVGRYLRYQYYRHRLSSCGKKVAIDTGVHFVNPKSIHLGNHVWIDSNVIIIGGTDKMHVTNQREISTSHSKMVIRGQVHIGEYSHIGVGTLIQGHGGVFMDAYCTTSAGCKIYSFSNDVQKCRTGTIKDAHFVVHPVLIGSNSWLGINSTVLGHEIGANSFIKPYTLVTENVQANTIYGNAVSVVSRKRFEDI